MSEDRHRQTWIRTTRQMWKVHVSTVLCLLAFGSLALMFLDIDGPQISPRFGRGLALASFVVGGVAPIWLVFSVRCRRCRGFVAWHFMKTADVRAWLFHLVTCAACPICNAGPGDADDAQARIVGPSPWWGRGHGP